MILKTSQTILLLLFLEEKKIIGPFALNPYNIKYGKKIKKVTKKYYHCEK
jgi:hypothetical protein